MPVSRETSRRAIQGLRSSGVRHGTKSPQTRSTGSPGGGVLARFSLRTFRLNDFGATLATRQAKERTRRRSALVQRIERVTYPPPSDLRLPVFRSATHRAPMLSAGKQNMPARRTRTRQHGSKMQLRDVVRQVFHVKH